MKIDVSDVSGILLSDQKLMRLLQVRFRDKILRVETEQDSFRISFDPSKPINAAIMGREDMVDFMRKFFGRPVIEVSDEGHEHYLVRFEE
jgi:hypothetical protein